METVTNESAYQLSEEELIVELVNIVFDSYTNYIKLIFDKIESRASQEQKNLVFKSFENHMKLMNNRFDEITLIASPKQKY